MRFVDFLRVTVLLSAASATALATVTVLVAGRDGDRTVVLVMAAWWVVAGLVGAWLGRRAQASPPIRRLLAEARTTTTLPELRVGSVLLNRLWPLLVVTIGSVALAFLAAQIPGIATGFAIAFALSWRRQESAVTAIEDRDGVAFYVEPTSPLRPIRLVRAPGFRRELTSVNGVAP